MPPLVSILIPCYNAERWVGETLESALAQTWPRKEIILVDDGSTDRSLAVAESYASRGVRVFRQANAGASAARNRALAQAQGDYLQFLDADDLLAPDKVERQMELAAGVDGSAVLSGAWSRFVGSTNDADFTPQVLCADAAPVDWLVIKLEQNAMMHPAAWLTPRSLAEKAGPWDESLSLDDDGEYFSRVVLASSGTRHCSRAVSFYRSRIAGSLSRARSERAWQSALRSLELLGERLGRAEDSPRTRHARATALQRFVYEAYPAARDCRRRARELIIRLGGSDLAPEGGPRFQLARRLIGWRGARRLQTLF